MVSTVVNPIDSSVVSGTAVAWSLPSNVFIRSGEESRFEIRSAAPACTSPTIAKKSNNTLLIPHFKKFVGYLIASDVPEVQAVLMHQEDKLLRVYVATKEFDFDANERIYDKEERLINLFKDVDFDFHIVGQRRFGDPGLKVVYSR